MELFHTYDTDISGVELPEKFNNPFRYRPHTLCVLAADEVRAHISKNSAWSMEAAQGKMFGVLVVQDVTGAVGYLAAYSGLLCGSNSHPFFVPAIYDMLAPDGYFKIEESRIVSLNKNIEALETAPEYIRMCSALEQLQQKAETEISSMRTEMQQAKQARDARRVMGNLSDAEKNAMVLDSQHRKAEYKRLVKKYEKEILACRQVMSQYSDKITAMKNERKTRSAELQKWLFRQFNVLNAHGCSKTILQIFQEQSGVLPPAGTGECAAPKLLQYAYRHHLQPLCMAEFWVGASPVGELRRDGCFYGSCKGKCGPLLGYMLQGLCVDALEAAQPVFTIGDIKIVYEDESIMVVNKPSGILSVPGLTGGTSVQELLQRDCCSNSYLAAHRLDMSTSGLLVVAKSAVAYKSMQSVFASRKAKKCYMALLDGVPQAAEGTVALPLAPDYMNRPMQMVDTVNGKEAVTEYKILSTMVYKGRKCAVALLRPITGRTHQLRVHCAHAKGLNTPIVGDELYGTCSERLMLHASHLEFNHPITGEPLAFASIIDFERGTLCKQ